MKPMTRKELAETDVALGGYAIIAQPETIAAVLKAVHQAEWHRANPVVAEQFVRKALAAVPSLMCRIVDADRERAAVRSTIARLVVANQRGDDYGLSDLASELEQAGIDLKDDYDVADDLARATEQEGLL